MKMSEKTVQTKLWHSDSSRAK